MNGAARPIWWEPGLSDSEIAIREAAERCAATAPTLRRGDDITLRLQQLYAGFPEFLREHRAARERDTAA